uniref:Uncharacterized protein n=1 Tax=Magallana gigas TaxID=29159 RepID=K1PPS2_MAGGI
MARRLFGTFTKEDLTDTEVLLFPAMKPDITKKSGEETDKQPPRPPVAEFPGLHTTP